MNRILSITSFFLLGWSLSAAPAPVAEHVPGRLIVHHRLDADPSDVEETLGRHGARIHRRLDGLDASVIEIPEQQSAAILQSLRGSGRFRNVEYDYYAHTAAVPNDPQYGSQWHLSKIQAPAAWDVNTGSSGVLIAILDSGVDPTHPDLVPRLVPGWNFVNGSSNTTDVLGHGTAVAGTVAASTNNSTGVAGVTWNNPIMPLVVVDPSDYASYSNIATAIQYAADHGARIINISIGGTSSSSVLQSAVDYAWGKGALIFASAMNNSNSTPNYPAACNNVMAISATDANDNLASFSNYGNWITLSAPGNNILTTNSGGGYGYWYGTSFASPVAAGVAALALSVNPSLTNSALVQLLETNSDDLGPTGYDSSFGWGRVNAYRAVAAAKAQLAPPPPPPPPVSVSVTPLASSLTNAQTQQFTATVSGATNTAVSWSVNPAVGTISATGLYTAPSVVSQQSVTIVATSVADPTKSAGATVTLTPPAPSAFSPIRVNAGGSAYTDSQGRVWSADTGATGGYTWSTGYGIANTSAPVLYQACRYGYAFTYQFAAPNGNYTVNLKFAEVSQTAAGQRVFNVAINGAPVLTNFDIFAQAGGALIALDKPFAVNVTGGQITIQFTTGTANSPLINAIEILSASGVAVAVNPASSNLTAGQAEQLTASVSGTSNTAVTWSIASGSGSISTTGVYTSPASLSSTQNVVVTATSAADPTQSASATVSVNPAPVNPSGFTPIRVNAGGSAYTDAQGNLWSADTGYTSSYNWSVANSIGNTSTPLLYQTCRYGYAFTYQFTVPNGNYSVNLKFAEVSQTAAGQRLFNVALNGTPVLTNFDVFAQAGGAFLAADRSFPVAVTGGQIAIQFTTGSANSPLVNAIEILQATPVAVTVTPGTASLLAGQSQTFTATVTGSTNTAVSWSVSPALGSISSNGIYTAPASVASTQNVIVTAISTADPTKSASATVTVTPSAVASFTPIRVNAGGSAYTDAQGNLWSADTGSTGGYTWNTGNNIAGTPTPLLYQTCRYGDNFSYQFTVPNGSRTVTLKFAEVSQSAAGQRQFNVAINGATVLTNFDIYAQAGGPLIALDRSFPVTVAGGQIAIQFSKGLANSPLINSIEID